jgi:hypothetical protein
VRSITSARSVPVSSCRGVEWASAAPRSKRRSKRLGRKQYRTLFTYHLVHNAAALGAYTKHGVSIVGTARRHARIRNNYVDMLVVERLLS